MDWDDAVGISMPLYTLVDVLFELQSRGFFRRQVREATNPRPKVPPRSRNSRCLPIHSEVKDLPSVQAA